MKIIFMLLVTIGVTFAYWGDLIFRFREDIVSFQSGFDWSWYFAILVVLNSAIHFGTKDRWTLTENKTTEPSPTK